MVDRNLGIFSNQNNDSDILMNEILKKDYVYIRDKPAIDHLVKLIIIVIRLDVNSNDFRCRFTAIGEREKLCHRVKLKFKFKLLNCK